MSVKSKIKETAKKLAKKLTPVLELPFEERMKMFDIEYKELSKKYGVFHNPVNIYDDSTIPGGLMNKTAEVTPTEETPKA